MYGFIVNILKSDIFDYYEIENMTICEKNSNFSFKNLKKGESISYFSSSKEEHYFVDSLDKIKEKVVYFLGKNVPYKNDFYTYLLNTNVFCYFPDLRNWVYNN